MSDTEPKSKLTRLAGAPPSWIRHYREARDAYALVFVLVVVTVGALAVVPAPGPGAVLLTTLQALTMLLALRTSGVKGHRLLVLRVMAASAVLVVIASTLLGRVAGPVYFVVMIVLIVGAQASIIVRIVQQPRISTSTVMGALSVYLLVGLLFATLYGFYGSEVGPFFTQSGAHGMPDLLYFSFVTLTTVGYGDLTPGPAVARMMAMSEALLGQLYLVTVISLIIGNLGRETDRRAREHVRDARGTAEEPAEP